jgi:hypothetical protein
MIRASKAQLELLERNLARGGDEAPPVLRTSRRREDLPENQLERQITDFLAWRGFISVRQHIGLFVPFRVVKQLQQGQISFEQAMRNIVRLGEEGASDWWSARPIIPAGGRAQDGPHPWQAFYWEAKATGKRPTDAQLAWLDKRRQVGLEATWFNQFGFRDRPAPVVDARESPVFEVWFYGYFNSSTGGIRAVRAGG